MTKDTEKKLAEGKKASRGAAKQKEKNTVTKNAAKSKKISTDKAALNMAANLPAGASKAFLMKHSALMELKRKRKEISLAIRGVRGEMKEMKIELRVYDHVVKMAEMEPEDSRAFKATEALYTEQLGMELSPQQKEALKEINSKRDTQRKAMAELGADKIEDGEGEEEKKEEGDTDGDEKLPSIKEPDEEQEGEQEKHEEKTAAAVPAKNEGVRKPHILERVAGTTIAH